MKQSIPTFLIITSSILWTGCATRKYVRQTVDPVRGDSIRSPRRRISTVRPWIRRAQLWIRHGQLLKRMRPL
jgi:hypothetical protein